MRSVKSFIMFIIAILAVNFVYGQNYFSKKIGLTNSNFISSLDNQVISYFSSMISKNGFAFGNLDYTGNYKLSLNLNVANYSFYMSNHKLLTDTIIYNVMPEFKELNMTDIIFGFRGKKTNYSIGLSFNNTRVGGDSSSVGMSNISYIGGICNIIDLGDKVLEVNVGINVRNIKCSRVIDNNVSSNKNRPGYNLNLMTSIIDDENVYDIFLMGYSGMFDFIYNDSIPAYNGKEIYTNNYKFSPGISWSRSYADYADIKFCVSYLYSSLSTNSYDNSGDTSKIRCKTYILPNVDYEVSLDLFKGIYMDVFGNFNYKINDYTINGKKILEKESDFLYNIGVGYSNGDISIIVGGEGFIENILKSIKSNRLDIPIQLRFYYQIDNLTGI